MGSIPQWEELVSEKRSRRDRAIKQYYVSDLQERVPQARNVHERTRFDDPLSMEITDINSIVVLLNQLRFRKYTAQQVTYAYIKRAVIAHQLTNAVTETVFEEALSQARALDEHLANTGELLGPLHGIPITVKDQFDLKGVDTSLGYVGRTFSPALADAVIIRILKDMGAVILLKTNLPQTLMWSETDNPLWGRTANPRNPDLIAGGSSGGEGPLLALHGSLLGLGTDIGGSIRNPASMNGIYAFKPTSSRYPVIGVSGPQQGQEHVNFSSGPMARDMESLCYISRLVADSKPWESDPKCVPLPWNDALFQEMQSRPLVIGLIMDDGVVKVHPPVSRALEALTAKLKRCGHEIITWDTSDHRSCVDLMDQYYSVDGFEDVKRDIAVAGEPMIPHVQALADRAQGRALSVYEYWQLNKKKQEMREKFLRRWNSTSSSSGRPLDVLLGPTTAHTAIPHRTWRWGGYTKVWNLVDYPALTFPVDEVRKAIDKQELDYQPRNELDAWNWNLYDPDVMDGHVVNLQVIGKTFSDEQVLGAATVIENVWNSTK